jgi:hypothetical protein
MIMEQATSSETQAFLSDVADEMEAVATKLETSNGAVMTRPAGKTNRYLNARFGSKVLYTACYTLSYGVCFPVFVACRYLPKNNQFVEGLVDGGVSANQAADDLLARAEKWRLSRRQAAEESEVDS